MGSGSAGLHLLEKSGCQQDVSGSSWERGTPTPAPRTSLGLDSVLPAHGGPGSRRMKSKASTLVRFWEYAPVWPIVAVLPFKPEYPSPWGAATQTCWL